MPATPAWTDDVPDDVPAVWLADARELLTRGAVKGDVGLDAAAAVDAWVLHGDGHGRGRHPGLLTTRNADGWRSELGVDPWGAPGEQRRLRVATGLVAVPPPVGLRWAEVLEAACRHKAVRWFDGRLPDGACWPYALLMQAGRGLAEEARNYRPSRRPIGDTQRDGVPAVLLDALQVEAGWEPHTLLVTVLTAPHDAQAHDRVDLLAAYGRAPDLDDALVRHADAVSRAFAGRIGVTALRLAYLLDGVHDETLARYEPLLRRMAAASGKQVREAASVLLDRISAPGPTAADEPGGYDVVLPTVDWRVEVTPEVRSAVLDLWARLEELAAVQRRNAVIASHGHGPRTYQRFDAEDAETFLAALAEGHELSATRAGRGRRRYELVDLLDEWPAALPPVAALSLLAYLGELSHGATRGTPLPVRFLDAVRRATGGPTLLDLEAHLGPFGLDGTDLLLDAVDGRPGAMLGEGWPDDAVWPFVARNLDTVIALLRGTATGDQHQAWRSRYADRLRLLALVAALPHPPARLLAVLRDQALGGAKTFRGAAQTALDRWPGRDAAIAEALVSKAATARAAAAEWLAAIGDPGAVPALEAALRRERNDGVRAALLGALETFGRDPADYLDLDALLAQADKEAARPLPAALAWWDDATLPAVRWATPRATAQGEQTHVPPALLRRLVVQAVKAKEPSPNADVRRTAALLHPADRPVVGRYLLDVWLAHDLRPIDVQQARADAADEADGWLWAFANFPGEYAEHPWRTWSREQIAAALLPAAARRPAGSATDSKGLLAVVAACGAPDAGPTVERYLKQWQGKRSSQAKSLLAVLAALDDLRATQTLLGVARTFRVAGIQEEAARLAGELAERTGWTVDELADRTVPTGGFGEDGRMTLSYGPREFTAVLRPDLTIGLEGPDGAALTALPGVRKTDDAEAAAEAKAALAGARKTVKAVAAQQADRLYEALVVGRTWRADEWLTYLVRHPLVRHLVAGLVWAQTDGDGAVLDSAVVRTFRPLDDGSLTDADDAPVTLDADARVRLADDDLLEASARDAWLRHLADYEVTPPFGQLGRVRYDLTGREDARAVEDVRGHVIGSLALRGAAARVGWSRGPVEEGPWVNTYVRRFPALGWEAVLEYTGEELEDADRQVALMDLTFRRLTSRRDLYGAAPAERLRDVPPVLLADRVADVVAIAAAGEGYDPDWEKLR